MKVGRSTGGESVTVATVLGGAAERFAGQLQHGLP